MYVNECNKLERLNKRVQLYSKFNPLSVLYNYVIDGCCLADGHSRQSLSWTQRIAAAIGIAKGIQFLHTGIVPGIYANNLKITDIFLDQSLSAKINSCNLPLLSNIGKVWGRIIITMASLNGRQRNYFLFKSFFFQFFMIEGLSWYSLMSTLQGGHRNSSSGQKSAGVSKRCVIRMEWWWCHV